MYTIVTVKKVFSDKSVLVSCSTSSCCGCKAEAFCNNKDQNEYLALNANDEDLQVGDFVELYLEPKKTILSTALVFALPLAMFPLGYFFMKTLIPHGTEGLWAIGAFGAMAIAFLIASLVSFKNKRKLMPIVSRKIHYSED